MTLFADEQEAELHAENDRLRVALRECLSAMEAFDGEGWTMFISPIKSAKEALNL